MRLTIVFLMTMLAFKIYETPDYNYDIVGRIVFKLI